ncbi:putative membrane protein [Dietzia kunjamensis]|uniref:DoxX family protein n=1 Tax=Dietzia TaxID=37914 RepID=UPI000FF073CA|nr:MULTISPECIES: hypothetical protein [Dietzia]MCY1658963.1 hypothetical protein [Dietzia sp. SL131]MEB8325267.1 hypothetical protein [Dietzia kunjamensis]RKE54801.1 putative membrane protein [Dietzia kunjamensis]
MSNATTRGTVRYWAMPAALGTMGALHFVAPRPFDGLIPPELPGSRRAWTYGSGVVEVAVAGLLAAPATRKVGGAVATALFIGVFPGNLQMVRAWRRKPVWPYQVIAWGRLPLQVPMILAADSIRRGA